MDSDAVVDALNAVHDRTTFLHFVQVLIDERTQATRLEADHPETYRWSGALNWQHNSIEDYLDGALRCVEDAEGQNDILVQPSWRAFADFLYAGKIYE